MAIKINGNVLSKAVMALILSGASAGAILNQFLDEKEGTGHLTSYLDGGGIWTICGGATRVDGQPVRKGMVLTAEKCAAVDKAARSYAVAWVRKNVRLSLTEPQIAGIASFCPYNIGTGKCISSTFWKKLQSGDQHGACAEIKRWVYDGGRDCNVRVNNCYGQVLRRDQESVLSCWGLQ